MPHTGEVFSVLIPLLIAAALISGAIATTAVTVPPPNSAVDLALQHKALARVVFGVASFMLAWIAFKRPSLRRLAAALIVGLATQSALGEMPNGVAGWGGLVHATLAQVLLAGGIALVVQVLPDWRRELQTIQDYGWPSLRSLAFTLPVLVGIQVVLGAASRHGILSLMPHLMGALVVSLFVLIVAAFVLQQAKDHKMLGLWARALMVLTVIQIFLGIGVFTVRSLPNQDESTILIAAAAHVTTGALLFSASAVLGMQIRRNVRPKPRS